MIIEEELLHPHTTRRRRPSSLVMRSLLILLLSQRSKGCRYSYAPLAASEKLSKFILFSEMK
jgi:hypothetical protein